MPMKRCYYRALAGIIENRQQAAIWARCSSAAALPSEKSKKKIKRNS
jgi:hypothetical protein